MIRQYHLFTSMFVMGLTVVALTQTNIPTDVTVFCIGIGVISGIVLKRHPLPLWAIIAIGIPLAAIFKSIAGMLPGPKIWNSIAIAGMLLSARILTGLIGMILNRERGKVPNISSS